VVPDLAVVLVLDPHGRVGPQVAEERVGADVGHDDHLLFRLVFIVNLTLIRSVTSRQVDE
jgi:hypothetical protein